MFNESKIVIVRSTVEPISSGTKIIKQTDGLFDVDGLHKLLQNDEYYVVVKNDVSKHSQSTKKQTFIFTDELYPEEGYDNSYVMTHYGRSNSGITNRKIILSFKGKGKTAICKASYYSS